MNARDDYAKLDATTRGLHHQGQTSTEAQAALDELDRLRAELADTPTLVNVGVNYCTVHHGITNEDDGPVCDFAGHNRRGSDAPCDLRPLGYVS